MRNSMFIGNDCTGARIYQTKNKEYDNPFMWCLIPPKSFSYLYHNFNTIDFKNIELKKDGPWYKVIIDGNVTVYYPHYRFDAAFTKPTVGKSGIDVYYNKIDEYIVEKYMLRQTRMGGTSIFIINDTKTKLVDGICTYKKEDLLEYVGLSDCYILTSDKSIKGSNVIYKPSGKVSSMAAAKIIIENAKI